MSCYRPLTAYRQEDGEVVFRETGRTVATLQLPCGQCVGCRVRRAEEWSIRVMHEAQMHEHCSFVTLTYDDEHLPPYGGLRYSDVQKFLKRLRVRRAEPVRYFLCGEYGEQTKRPHYHVGLFGEDFHRDRVPLRQAGDYQVWRSDALEKLWPLGRSEIGSLTRQSAGYIARYVLGKLNGEAGEREYRRFDAETGEVVYVDPPFCRMSLRPGIGATWFRKFGREVFPRDGVVADGRVRRVPRFYDREFDKINVDNDALSEVKYQRYLDALQYVDDNTRERLAVREIVEQARVGLNRRDEL